MSSAAIDVSHDTRLYRIGEVSRIADLKPFVLRYWETEFPMLEQVKSLSEIDGVTVPIILTTSSPAHLKNCGSCLRILKMMTSHPTHKLLVKLEGTAW